MGGSQFDPKAHIKKSAMVCNSNPRNIEMGGRDRWLSRAHWTAVLVHVVKFQDNKKPCPKKRWKMLGK